MDDLTMQDRLDSKVEEENLACQRKLCGKCLAISWNPDEYNGIPNENRYQDWRLNHHETFGELETSCETGCPLCQTFFSLLVYDRIDMKDTDILHWNIEHYWGKWTLSLGVDHRHIWSMESDDENQPSQSVAMVKKLLPLTLDEDLEALLEESINPWIEACAHSGKHNCCPRALSNESESHSMPTRLIDVGSDMNPTARLLETKDLSEGNRKRPYVTLSYCWGSGNDSARTTSRNFKERQDRIDCDILPKTIQDAIRITRLMRIQYLWVDAVCIIQTDKTLNVDHQADVATADWERESMNMASYYANCLCCIAASNAKDSSEGILCERRAARYGFRKWCIPPNVYFESPFTLRRRFPSSLFERGWCLQEWILSPRILHWTANGLIWECPEGFFWEGQKGFEGEAPESFENFRSTNDCMLEFGSSSGRGESICEILRSEKEDAIQRGWPALVEHYAQMRLSFSSDRLAAIEGIASILSQRHGVDYFAGIFETQCLEQLIWVSEDPPKLLDTADRFPTWSWLSSKGKIRVGWVGILNDFESWVENLEPFPSSQHHKSLTRITNKELRFTAPLLKLDMLEPEEAKWDETESEHTDPEDTDLEDSWLGCHRFVLGNGSPIWQGMSCNIHLDSLASSAGLKSRASLLLLRHESFRSTEYEGLVIQMVEGTGEQEICYRRIGMFFLERPGDYLQDLPYLKQLMTKVTLV